MIVKDFSVLASDTARTKAYLQMMVREQLIPETIIVYTDDFDKMKKTANEWGGAIREEEYFDLNKPILVTIEELGIEYSVVENKDINSNDMREAIRELDAEYCIYSGYGGYILKRHLFELGKKYVHVHAGILPQYRGSTTAYYSMLQEGYIGATAIFLNEKIDEGEILYQKKYSLPKRDVNIDVLYEPYIRSLVLATVMKRYANTGKLGGEEQSRKDAQTYYIIHPVLKHLAIMGIK